MAMRRIMMSVLAVVALISGSLALSGAASGAGASSRATIVGSHPSWAAPSARVADANGDDTMQFRVYLNLRDRAGAEALAQAVSDPSSSAYRSYLSTGQVKARFAPTDAAVSSVRTWLAGQGLQPGAVPDNNLYVEATGSVRQVERAFGVDLAVYSVRGQQVRSPSSDVSVPASLAGTVSGVVGIDQAFNLMRPDHVGAEATTAPSAGAQTFGIPTTVPPSDGFRNGRPCSAFYGEKVDTTDPAFGGGYAYPMPYAPCGYKPQQLRQAYGTQSLLDTGLDGSRATVAVIDAFASPTIFSDASTYARRNDPAHPLRRSQFRQVLFPTNPDLEGPDGCDAAGWYGEETLDIEAVHAMAPGAHIVYVGGSDCQDVSLDKALNLVISKNLAQIVSNSYGDLGEDIAPDEVAAFQDIAIQGVLQGIGVYFSSGDSGDEVADLGFPSPDFSASSPWVTAVGGTSLGVGANGQKLLETGWETGKSSLVDNVWTPARSRRLPVRLRWWYQPAVLAALVPARGGARLPGQEEPDQGEQGSGRP